MKLTKIICISSAIFIGIADAVLVYFYGIDGSISRWMQDTSYSAPLFVVMLGFLLGHFFSGNEK